MAKKKKMTYAKKNPLVQGKHRITVYLDPELKKAVRRRALDEEKTLSAFVTDLLIADSKSKA